MKKFLHEGWVFGSGFIWGLITLTLWWTGTHNCYETLVGLTCSRHSFDWLSAIEPWLRVVK